MAMRILHVGKFWPPFTGGIEMFNKDLADAQHAAGDRPAVVCHRLRDDNSTPTEPYPVDAVRIQAQLLYTPIALQFRRAIKERIATHRPDVIHIHMPNPSAFWLMTLKEAKQIPWVVHWHGDVDDAVRDKRLKLAYRVYRPFEQSLLDRSAAVIVTSPTYQRASSALTRWQEKCHVVPYGIDSDRLGVPDDDAREWADKTWGADGAFRLLVVGRLAFFKGHHILIDAMRDLDDCVLRIVGDGPLRKQLEEQVNQFGLHDRISFLGAVSTRDDPRAWALLDTCDCFCFPSTERTESFGIVLLEAMRYGAPVIAAQIPGAGVSWIIKHESNGLFVPTNDSTSLADAVRRLKNDPTLRQTLASQARKELQERFSLDAVVKEIRTVYDGVLD